MSLKDDLDELVALGIEPCLRYTPVSDAAAAREDPLDPEPRWACYDHRDRDFHEHGLEADEAVSGLLAIARAGRRPDPIIVARRKEVLAALDAVTPKVPAPRAGLLDELMEVTPWWVVDPAVWSGAPTMRYFLKHGDKPERQVTVLEYIETERACGFYPNAGCGPVATDGFSHSLGGVTIEGRTELIRPIHTAKEEIGE